MDIRPVLAVGLVVVAGAAASMLLFPALSNLGGPPDVTTADTPVLDPSVPAPYEGTKSGPAVVIRVGDAGNGFPIQVWNDRQVNRTVSLELIHNESDSSLVTRTETLPPNGTIRLELWSSAGYLLEVSDESTGETGTYPVTPDQFDCNDRFATVRIDGNGRIESRTIATTMGC